MRKARSFTSVNTSTADRTNITFGHKSEVKQVFARQMRRAMTPAEARLWQLLRAGRLAGARFHNQQIIDGFIADFYCHAAGLIVEGDGDIRDEQKGYDAARDALLSARGLRILRIGNQRVFGDLNNVLVEIRASSPLLLRKAKNLLEAIAPASVSRPPPSDEVGTKGGARTLSGVRGVGRWMRK